MERRRSSIFLAALLAAAPVALALAGDPAPVRPPNVVIVLADDLGFGDVGFNGGTVKTPNLDRLASQGLRFDDAHSAAATCTPSRYALLTGEYAWRRKGTGILPGDANLIIEPGRPTLPSLFKAAGYATGCVGKWHLGLGSGKIDWNGEIRPGPLEIGFDEAFIIPATGDRVPCVYVENHRVVGLDPRDPIAVSYEKQVGSEPTGRDHPGLLKLKPLRGHADTIVNGISRIGWMSGGTAARWKDEDIADVLTGKAIAFLEKNRERPFFLYFATHDIHVPRAPHPRFAGKSGCGVRGDVIVQFDWSVGRVMAALDRLGLADDTLLIVTSDNGPAVEDGYDDGAARDLHGHRPAGPLRGGKYTAFEGGTRVPFAVRWPRRIERGASEALICQVDFLATFASLLRLPLSPGAGPDSADVLPALLGDAKVSARDSLVEQGATLGLRRDQWKFIEGAAVQGGKKRAKASGRPGQLFDLRKDPGEADDLAPREPGRVREMIDLLERLRRQGRGRGRI